jgi:hypothetical protein
MSVNTIPVDVSRANQIEVGHFAIPKLNYFQDIPELNRERYTIRAMITNLRNQGYAELINQILPFDFIQLSDQQLIEQIEKSIVKQIDACCNKGINSITATELNTIFHLIQIWGGNTGRSFYFRSNGGLDRNFNIESYRNAVVGILSGDVDKAIYFFKELRQINIAFASKHFSFWTRSFQGFKQQGTIQLPILDRLIFNLTYGKSAQPDYRHYSKYLNSMYQASAELGISVLSIERQLFNFADTKEGKEWSNNRSSK